MSGREQDQSAVSVGISPGAVAVPNVGQFIVLCGSVRTTPLARRIGRALVDLPLYDGTTVGDRLIAGGRAFSERNAKGDLPVRLLVDGEGQSPKEQRGGDGVVCSVERDASPIRGVAGILSDATRGLDPDSYIVVANGAQLFREPLQDLVQAMIRKGGDVSMVASADGTPVGLWLIRCGVLRTVRDVGYIDLKEQALPEWTERFDVTVVERNRAYALRTGNISEYLTAVRADASGDMALASVDEDPFREDWEKTFGIVEEGANLGVGAVVHDSVVLSGASVGKGAVVVRSVVCPGASVAPGARVVGEVVAPDRGRG